MTSGSKIKSLRRESAMMPGPGPKPVRIDPATIPDIACPTCGATVFEKVYGLKEMAATHPQNPSGRAQRIEFVAYDQRVKCGLAIP